MTRFQLILPVHSQKPPNFKVVIEFFAQNRFSWPSGQLLPIHTIHILKAIVPAVNLAYLDATLYSGDKIDKKDLSTGR